MVETTKEIVITNEAPIVLGRSMATGIKDLRVSKHQVRLTLSADHKVVQVVNLGKHLSFVENRPAPTTLRAGEILYLLRDLHPHSVVIKDMESQRLASWTSHDGLVIFKSEGLKAKSKIAGFDIDNTIIRTKSGRTFPVDKDDWKILFPEVKEALQKAHKNGFKVVFFTNQSGIGGGVRDLNDFKSKVEAIIGELCVPVQVFISLYKDKYRKPITGMWDRLVENDNDNLPIDKSQSIFVGDAAGRPKEGKRKKDFSCSDRLFAMNIGIPFKTPEEYFLGAPIATFQMPKFDPSKMDHPTTILPINPTTQEVVVLVGLQASGKSALVKSRFNNYTHISRDILGTWQKCVKVLTEALPKGKSVVIDNTNPDVESRKRYIDVCGSVPCRCIWVATPLDQAKHNEKFRQLTTPHHKPIGGVTMNVYMSKFQEPHTSEGFIEVIKTYVTPTFTSSHDKELYEQFLVA